MAEIKKQKKAPKIKPKEILKYVKRKRILATYNIGVVGGSAFGNFTKTFRNIYFVQVMGLSNAQYASATVIGNIVNGVANPIIGFLMDKRIFRRKYSPWILINSCGVVLSYLLLYAIPFTPAINSTALSWTTAMIMVVLVGFFHAMSRINNSSIFAALTMDGRERIIAKMLSGWLGGLGKIVSKFSWPFIFAFFQNKFGDTKSYLPTVAVLAVMLMVFALIKWREIRKFVPGDIEGARICEDTGKLIVEDRLPAKEMIKNLLKNYPLFTLVLVGIVNMTKRSFGSTSKAMYFNYIVGDIRWMAVGAAFAGVFSPIFKIGIPALAIIIGDAKILAVTARFGEFFVRLGLYLFGKNVWAYIIIGFVGGGFNRMARIANGVLTAGAVDFGEWKNGVRHPGLIVAFQGMGANVGQAAGVVLRAWFFESIGFKKGFYPDEEFKNKFMLTFLFTGLFALVNGFLLLFFYPISKKKLEEIRVLVEERRAQKAAEEQAARRAARKQDKEE